MVWTSSKWGKIWLSSQIWPWRSRSIIPKNNRDPNQGVLHLWSKFGDPSLNGRWVIVRTSSWLIHTHTDPQTQAMTIPEGQNWPRVKISFLQNAFENIWKMSIILFRPQCVKGQSFLQRYFWMPFSQWKFQHFRLWFLKSMFSSPQIETLEVYLCFPWHWLSPFLFENIIWITGLRHHHAIIMVILSHHPQDNICNTTSVSLCSFHDIKIASEIRKINRLWPKSNQFWRVARKHQHTKFQAIVFSRECPETKNLTCFTESKLCHSYENQQTMNKSDQNLISFYDGQDTSPSKICGNYFHAFPG